MSKNTLHSNLNKMFDIYQKGDWMYDVVYTNIKYLFRYNKLFIEKFKCFLVEQEYISKGIVNVYFIHMGRSDSGYIEFQITDFNGNSNNLNVSLMQFLNFVKKWELEDE